MKIEDPLYDIEDQVRTVDGPRIVCGRAYREWWWLGGPTKSWTYHCQPFEIDKETKKLKRTGTENKYSALMIHGKL